MCLDLDENGPASLHAIRTTGDVPVPTLVLDTSPEKNQVVWRVDGLERDHAESLLRSLATQFRGDPAATDISRVLRVPGFRNWKYNEPFQVRAIQETDQVYQLRDFVVHEDSPDRGRDLNETRELARRTPPAHRSQSKRIGRTPNARSRVATIRKKLFAASLTTGRKTRPIRTITRDTRLRKPRPTCNEEPVPRGRTIHGASKAIISTKIRGKCHDSCSSS
jgi:RepB DNA-primase from phage plasmid